MQPPNSSRKDCCVLQMYRMWEQLLPVSSAWGISKEKPRLWFKGVTHCATHSVMFKMLYCCIVTLISLPWPSAIWTPACRNISQHLTKGSICIPALPWEHTQLWGKFQTSNTLLSFLAWSTTSRAPREGQGAAAAPGCCRGQRVFLGARFLFKCREGVGAAALGHVELQRPVQVREQPGKVSAAVLFLWIKQLFLTCIWIYSEFPCSLRCQ